VLHIPTISEVNTKNSEEILGFLLPWFLLEQTAEPILIQNRKQLWCLMQKDNFTQFSLRTFMIQMTTLHILISLNIFHWNHKIQNLKSKSLLAQRKLKLLISQSLMILIILKFLIISIYKLLMMQMQTMKGSLVNRAQMEPNHFTNELIYLKISNKIKLFIYI
jgi:hypothetical protein